MPEWCNGNTADSDSAALGSIPSSGAIMRQRVKRFEVTIYKTTGEYHSQVVLRQDHDGVATMQDANDYTYKVLIYPGEAKYAIISQLRDGWR